MRNEHAFDVTAATRQHSKDEELIGMFNVKINSTTTNRRHAQAHKLHALRIAEQTTRSDNMRRYTCSKPAQNKATQSKRSDALKRGGGGEGDFSASIGSCGRGLGDRNDG
jgi:hypothetical protein